MATLFNTRIADTYQGLLKTIDNGILGAGFTEISDGSGNGTSVFLNTGGDLEATGIVSFGSLKDIGENITITKFIDAADGLINNDNDTTIPTSGAIIDYVAAQITLEDLDFIGDGGSTGSVDLDSQSFSILGTTNQITTSASSQTLTIGLPSSVTISGTLTATTFSGDLNGTINTATTATTQSAGDNSTKVATTAYVDSVVTAQDLDFAGTTGSGSVDLDSQIFTIQGTTNEITTVASGQTLTISLPSSISTNLVGNVTGNLTGDVNGNVTGNTNGVHTGNVVGNVTGDLTGNTTGLHTGNVTGNVTGDLTGAVTGNVTGNLTGDVTGNVTGDLTGNVTGSVTGNVTGNLTGNVTGNVTGDLTGNADSATAWATGRTISLTGEATGTTSSLDGTANVSAAVTLTNSSVIGKVLTGLQSPAGSTILATDTMLSAFGKLQSQINGIAEGLQFQGSWNASTNTPTLTSSTGTQGHYYIVSVAGSTNLDGITDWEVGDWAIFSTTGVWQRLDQTGVQGTGTTGNLTKWATGSTIADSIVSESGTALTVTGSLNTTLATTVDGNLTVGTDSLIVNSVSDAVSMAGILTVASPVINTGISGSAVLDDDTFATASATTVATSESIKAYVDAQDQGSGTIGTIPKFATSTTFNNSVITESSSELFLGGETYIPSNELIVGANNQNASTEYLEIDGGTGSFIGGGGSVLSYNQTLSIGTVDAESVSLWTNNQQRLNITSGGTATFYGNLIANGTFDVGTFTISGSGIIADAAMTLQVSGGSANALTLAASTGLATFGSSIILNNNEGIFWEATSGANEGIASNGSDLLFYTAGVNRLTISSVGDLSTSDGTFTMHDGGGSPLAFKGKSSNGGSEIDWYANNGTTRIGYLEITQTAASKLNIETANNFEIYTNSTKHFTIGSSGYLIQNASSDTSTYFQIQNQGTTLGYLGNDSSLANAPTTATQLVLRSENDMAFTTGGGTRRLVITTGGDVGIGHDGYNGYTLSTRGVDTTSSNFALFAENSATYGLFSVRNDGVIGTGSSSAVTYCPYNLNVSTSVRDLLVDSAGTIGTAASIRKAKINIESETDVSWLYDLNPVKFNYRKKDEKLNYLNEAEEEQKYGLIAEEVEKVNTDFCWYNVNEKGEKDLVGVDYKMLISPMLKAIQEQQTIIETLTARLDALEKKA